MPSNPVTAAIQWSGPVLVAGAIAFGAAVILISSRPENPATLSPDVAALLLVSTALLLLSVPAMYAVQADAAGTLGLVGHIMLATGLLLPVLVAAPR